MQRNVANTVIGLVAFIALVLGLLIHKVLTPAPMSQEQLSENGLFVYDIPRRLAAFQLTDQDGQPFTGERLKGRWSLLYFGYTYCPDICPVTMATLRQFQEQLAKVDADAAAQTQVVFISVDPARDTPEKLKQYVRYFGADYQGATAEYIDVFNLARQLNIAFAYVPQGDEGDYLVNHSGEVLLINPEGDFQGFFKFPQDPAKMVLTFRALLQNWKAVKL
ncbi:MAG: SCO family protein [Pseudomonadales bacterium]|jgi:protein SCO1/2|nr:SCO family protein [Pseudomonadales bacterium]